MLSSEEERFFVFLACFEVFPPAFYPSFLFSKALCTRSLWMRRTHLFQFRAGRRNQSSFTCFSLKRIPSGCSLLWFEGQYQQNFSSSQNEEAVLDPKVRPWKLGFILRTLNPLWDGSATNSAIEAGLSTCFNAPGFKGERARDRHAEDRRNEQQMPGSRNVNDRSPFSIRLKRKFADFFILYKYYYIYNFVLRSGLVFTKWVIIRLPAIAMWSRTTEATRVHNFLKVYELFSNRIPTRYTQYGYMSCDCETPLSANTRDST